MKFNDIELIIINNLINSKKNIIKIKNKYKINIKLLFKCKNY